MMESSTRETHHRDSAAQEAENRPPKTENADG
jgi:hypothetical protein